MQKEINLSEKIFVAGANGMVGSAVCRELINSGYGKKENNALLLVPSRKELDLLNYAEVNNWFTLNKPSVVILAAAKVGGIQANNQRPGEFILENLKIQNNVIELAWRHGVKKFLFLGSSCIYPKYAKQPIEESSLLKEELEPTNESYAIAKISGIKLCQALRKQYQFNAISLMPTNLYGPGDNYHPENSHVMAALIRKFYIASRDSLKSVKCWGTGSPYREFLHVDDLANAVIFALENWNPDSKNAPRDKNGEPLLILNVGSGKDLTIKDLALKIAYHVDYKGDIIWDSNKPDGTPRKLLNIEKIKSLGWDPKIDLDDGIVQTIKLLKNKNKSDDFYL
tara:strand:+ start:1305 stop:2321 length:1017 start_codon:yes stop_codon:yes gene_type:complete